MFYGVLHEVTCQWMFEMNNIYRLRLKLAADVQNHP